MAQPAVAANTAVVFSVRDQIDDFAKQDTFRAQVSFERIVADAFKADPTVVPELKETGETWAARGFAVLSLAESAVKTVLSVVAYLISFVADKVFGAEWGHEAYGESFAAQFASFWRSGLMIVSPNAALASAFTTRQVDAVDDSDKVIEIDNPEWVKRQDPNYVKAPMEQDVAQKIAQKFDQTVPVIGRDVDPAVDPTFVWGTTGDLDAATFMDKMKLVGTIV